MPTVPIAGRKLFYREAGSGLPVLLFHGFPFTSESYWPQLDAPPRGCRLIAVDHRGFGLSERGPGVSTMEELATDGAALLDALKLPSAVIGGVSMGGYVSLAFAKKFPNRTKALLLLDTQASADDEAGRARREASAKDAEAHGMAPIAEAMMPRLFGPEAPAQAKERIEAMMRANDPQGTAAASRGMGAREDTLDVLRKFPGHVLVLVGEKDVITPVEKAKAMAEACPGATLEVVEGAGHLAHLEKPERVNKALGEFLAKVK